MASTYTTIQGDTWDSIAYKLFGDESYMKDLIEANWDYVDVLVFSGNTVLTVPDISEEADEDLPFWRSDDADDDDESYSLTEDEEDDDTEEDDDSE